MNQSRKPNSAIVQIVTTALETANRENPTVPVPRAALAEVASELWRLRELALRESLSETPRERTPPQAFRRQRPAPDDGCGMQTKSLGTSVRADRGSMHRQRRVAPVRAHRRPASFRALRNQSACARRTASGDARHCRACQTYALACLPKEVRAMASVFRTRQLVRQGQSRSTAAGFRSHDRTDQV
jgi:hypothetical protein